MADFNLENIATELNFKLSKTECVRYPVSKWQSSDGLSWSTTYNDSWKECGGVVVTAATVASVRLVFPNVKFKDGKYTLNLTNITGGASVAIRVTEKNAEYFEVNTDIPNVGYYSQTLNYYACGY